MSDQTQEFKKIKDSLSAAERDLIVLNTEIKAVSDSLDSLFLELGVTSIEEVTAKFEKMEKGFIKAKDEIIEEATSLGLM